MELIYALISFAAGYTAGLIFTSIIACGKIADITMLELRNDDLTHRLYNTSKDYADIVEENLLLRKANEQLYSDGYNEGVKSK